MHANRQLIYNNNIDVTISNVKKELNSNDSRIIENENDNNNRTKQIKIENESDQINEK